MSEIHRCIVTGEAMDRLTAAPEGAELFRVAAGEQCRVIHMKPHHLGMEILVAVEPGPGEPFVRLMPKPKDTDPWDPLKFD